MSLESDNLNRRNFLKNASTASVALVSPLEALDQKPEEVVVNNKIELFKNKGDLEKIVYPDTPEEITPQISEIINAINAYQFHHSDVVNGAPTSDPLLNVNNTREKLYAELKILDPTLPEFSDDNFYKTLTQKIPIYLSKYGIYVNPEVVSFTKNYNGNPIALHKFEVKFMFLKVDRVEHNEVEIMGERIEVDIIHLVESGEILSPQSANKDGTGIIPAGQTVFGDIFVFKPSIEFYLKNTIKNITDMKDQVTSDPNIIETKEEGLKRSNTWGDACNVGVLKLAKRIKSFPDYDLFLKQVLTHETRHLIDRQQGDLYANWGSKTISDLKEYSAYKMNFKIHDEINPQIAELWAGKESVLLYFLAISSKSPEEIPFFIKKPIEWVVRNIVDIIEKEGPSKYGIDISLTEAVSIPNQIVSKLDVLFKVPYVFDQLCKDLLLLHKRHIADNLLDVNPLQARQSLEPTPILSRPEAQFAILSTLSLSALYGLKKLFDRKSKVNRDNMTRQGRKKLDKANKPKKINKIK